MEYLKTVAVNDSVIIEVWKIVHKILKEREDKQRRLFQKNGLW